MSLITFGSIHQGLNGLVMNLQEEKRFLCVQLLYYVSNFADSRTEEPSYVRAPIF